MWHTGRANTFFRANRLGKAKSESGDGRRCQGLVRLWIWQLLCTKAIVQIPGNIASYRGWCFGVIVVHFPVPLKVIFSSLDFKLRVFVCNSGFIMWYIYIIIYIYSTSYTHNYIFTPLRVGWPPNTAGLFRSVRGGKGGVEYEEQSSTGELTYITAGFVNIFLIFTFPPPWGLPKLGNFHFPPPWRLPKLGNFHFSPPWQLPKL